MRHFLLFLLISTGALCNAQTRSDLIYKIDKTSFSAVVDEIAETEILYFLPNDTSRRTPLKISRTRVWKIVYENGETEVINEEEAKPIASAVAPKPVAMEKDRIFLKNKTMLRGKVVGVTDHKIEYRKEQSGPVFELLIKDVSRVTYADGTVEAFETPVAEKAISEKPKKVESVAKTHVPAESATKQAGFLTRLSATAGFDANYFLGAKDWIDKEDGLGFMTSMGGSLQLNYKFDKPYAVYFTAGYARAATDRNYFEADELVASEKYSLAGANAGLGLKYFLTESFYALGEAKASFLKAKFTYTESGETEEYAISKTCPSFSVGIGFTKKFSKIIVDANIHYQLTNSAFKDVTSDPIHLVGARLGIGLAELFKK